MCGILGILSKNNKKLSEIHQANHMIQHRGPDDNGVYIDINIALAHQRLAIIDLSENGHQPMLSDDENYVMVFNGEIYNHMEFLPSLQGKYKFKSTSDTETLLYGFIEYGPDFFKKLNGIFALAIFDKQKRRLTIARDHFGVKPLYICQENDELYFSSELKSFLKIPGWNKSIDHSALTNYLHFLWSPGERTPFKNIKKVQPGHYAIVDIDQPSSLRFHQFYDIPFDGGQETYSEEEWIRRIDQRFSNAVERQLMSDVPVGFFLSGGLDSSLIVAKAKELTGERLRCFTIDTDFDTNNSEGFANDLSYAKKVAKYLDVELEIVKSEIEIVNDFDKMIWHLDEPQADAAPLNILNICKLGAQMGYKVLLGGAGGDDLYSGYRRHQALDYEKYLRILPNVAVKAMQSIINTLPVSNANVRRAQKLLKHAHLSPVERMAGYYEWLPLSATKSLFSADIKKELTQYDPGKFLIDRLSQISKEDRPLNQMLYWDMKYFLADHNLNYTDKLSMAVGLEVRVPFLDLDLVNQSTRLPVGFKMKGNMAKYILKKVGEKYLPKEVIYRPKTGFGAPVRKWITKDLNDMIHEYLSPSNIKNRGIFDSKSVWSLIEKNKSGKIDASYTIWCLLAIESWMKQFADV